MKTNRHNLLNIETLETRDVATVSSVSIVWSSTYQTNDIYIQSNSSASNVSVTRNGSNIEVQEGTMKWARPSAGITGIVFQGSNSNDRFINNISDLPVRAYGYGGNDYLEGYDKADQLWGGDGNDTLKGYGGNDKLVGGFGRDSVQGMNGHDILQGDGDNDYLHGGEGNDYLNGGTGKDSVFGGNGTDTFRRSLFFTSRNDGSFLTGQPQEDENTKGDIPQDVTGTFLADYVSSTGRDNHLDVKQRATPTCAFLATLASNAERNTASTDLVQAIKYNSGTDDYSILMNINGSWGTYRVNGDWTEGQDPAGKLWVTLYQKAYLKAMGLTTRDADGRLLPETHWISPGGTNYRRVADCFKALTSANSEWVSSSAINPTKMQSDVRRVIRGMVAESKTSGTTGVIEANHAYMVYDAFVQNNKWMVKLYNPWGVDHTNQALLTDSVNDGYITLTLDSFKSNFLGYTWCN